MPTLVPAAHLACVSVSSGGAITQRAGARPWTESSYWVLPVLGLACVLCLLSIQGAI
jgi:hypothetical protein